MIFGRDPLANPELLIRRVYAYVAYRVGHGPEAEDLTSDTFERALRYRDSYDARKGEPIAWLIGIARRCIDGSVRPGAGTAHEPADQPDALDLEQEALARLELHQALACLSADERELIALHYGADLSARRIGELLGRRTNAVEVALHRARARLRAELEEPTVRKPAPGPVDEIGESTV